MPLSKTDNQLIAIWLAASLVAVIMALNYLPASLVNGEYIPVGNDAFYHARRIIDAAIGERGFYQFDDMIHAPEGSWLVWPWGFDFIIAQALKVALWLSPETQPMAFLAYVPVFWLLVNTGLMVLVGRALGLGNAYIGVALIGFVLSPLTQNLHGVGSLDHHFAELSFVLLSVWLGLRYLNDPSSRAAAIQLGVALGVASAVHNSLVIIQIPFLLTVFLQWARGRSLALAQALPLSIALFVSTLVIVLPSEPFREGFFDFATLSAFHLYVAFCSGAGLLLLRRFDFSLKNLGIVTAALLLLALPLLFPLFIGVNYVAGQQVGLQEIQEVATPLKRMLQAGTHLATTQLYGFLIFLTPVLAAAFAWLAFKRRDDDALVYFGVAGFLGLCLLASQIRFHPFGSWAMTIGAVYFAREAARHFDLKVPAPALVGVLMLVAMYPPLKYQLFQRFVPGLDREYAVVQPMIYKLAEACREEPGVALTTADDGHPVRYHTDCSVVMNNFLLTPIHGEKRILGNVLLELQPGELTSYAPGIRYLLVHIYGIYTLSEEGPQPTPIETLKSSNSPLFSALAIDGRVPDHFELIAELRVDDERDFAYAQVYRIAASDQAGSARCAAPPPPQENRLTADRAREAVRDNTR